MGPEKIEDEIHTACGKNETQKVTDLLIQRRKEINPKLLDGKGSLFEAKLMKMDRFFGRKLRQHIDNPNFDRGQYHQTIFRNTLMVSFLG